MGGQCKNVWGEKEKNTKFWSEILKENDCWEKHAWMEGCVITDLTYLRCTD